MHMNQEAQDTWNQRWTRAVSRSWSDAAFKKRLLANPREALRDAGVDIPSHVQVNIAEDSASVINLVLPADPTGELSSRQLEGVAGGGSLQPTLRQYSSPWLSVVKFANPPS
jgi:Nitrile hydratase, alpha chain